MYSAHFYPDFTGGLIHFTSSLIHLTKQLLFSTEQLLCLSDDACPPKRGKFMIQIEVPVLLMLL